MLKNLLQNQQNLKARGIYSCTGIYFFKSAEFISSRGDTVFSFRSYKPPLVVRAPLPLDKPLRGL